VCAIWVVTHTRRQFAIQASPVASRSCSAYNCSRYSPVVTNAPTEPADGALRPRVGHVGTFVGETDDHTDLPGDAGDTATTEHLRSRGFRHGSHSAVLRKQPMRKSCPPTVNRLVTTAITNGQQCLFMEAR
jgi:hypothetical protein